MSRLATPIRKNDNVLVITGKDRGKRGRVLRVIPDKNRLIVEGVNMNISKQPPILEDLRNHSQEEIAELRVLLNIGAPSRPDPRRPGFFEVSGVDRVYYIFKYPNGSKVLLLGVWDRDPVAEMVASSCPAA